MEKVDRIGQLLLKEKVITEEKLKEALEKQKTVFSDKPLGEVLIEQDLVKENDFLRVLAKQFRTQYVTIEKLANLNVPNAILRLIPQAIAEKHTVLPIQYSKKEKSLSIVTTDPMDVAAIDDIKFASGIGNIKPLVAIKSAISSGIEKFYKGNDQAFDMAISVDDDESSQQGYDDMMQMQMMGSSNEIVLEPDTDEEDKNDDDAPLEISTDIEFAKTESRPPALEDSPSDETDLPEPSTKDSVFLGGLDEFPGDDNLQRDPGEQVQSVEVEPVNDVPPPVEETAPAPKPKEKPKEKSKEAKKYHRKMLVVEPHDQIRKFVTKLFHREGYEVEGVANREEVFLTVEQSDFDVLVIKEKSIGEGTEFEEKLKETAPDLEVHIIKDYGSTMVGDTRLYYKLIDSFFESMDVIIGLMEMDREGYQGHTHQVAKYAKLIAQKMDLSKQDVNETIMGAYAHDLGKKGITHYTLIHLLEEDYDKDTLKDSLEIPVRLLSPANLPMNLEKVISNSLERYDGNGFPGKLKGDEIPIGARILTVVDSFSFLIAEGWDDRKYAIPDAMGFIQENSGKLFDPKVVDMLATVVKDDLFVGMMDADKEHILIVDPEADLTTLLELKFVNAGYMVTIARNGEEALKKAQENPPDFILADTDLPKLDGFKFIEELQATDVGEVPFLYLSKKDDAKLITRAFDLGAEDVINKPVRTEVLFAKVNRIMERIKRSKKAAAPGQAAGVSGSLSEMSLPDIVQILGAGRRTCLLTINHDSEKSEIFFEEGHIVNTVYNDMQGEEAFYTIIGWDSGTFTISPEVEIGERLITKNNESLMLEGFRRLDEGGHAASPDDVSIDGTDFF